MANLNNMQDTTSEFEQETDLEEVQVKSEELPATDKTDSTELTSMQEGGEAIGEQQEESKSVRKKRQSRKKGISDTSENETDSTTEELGNESEESEVIYESDTPPAEKPVKLRKRAPLRLDAEGKAVFDNRGTGHQDMAALSAAMKSRKVLCGTLTGFETEKGQMPKAHVMYGNVTVSIPFEQMGIELPPDDDGPIRARLQVNSMLGAKVFFVVLGVDIEERVAVASRSQASKMRRNQILNRKTASGEYAIDKGAVCTAQILHVSPKFARIEIYGREISLHVTDISDLWVNDLRDVLKVGEERMVEIASMERNEETGEITAFRVSMKSSGDDEIPTLVIGQTYTGTITNWTATSYYLRVTGIPVDVCCPIREMYEMEPLELGDTVRFFVKRLNRDGRAIGAIMRLLKKKCPTG